MNQMNQEIITKAAEIIKSETTEWREGLCALALIDEDGYPTVSTVTIATADGIKELTFCAGLSGNKAKRIQKTIAPAFALIRQTIT